VLYSVLPSFILGFHGCDKSVADQAIIHRRPLKFSENQYDWLGSGIYFWENSPQRALEWAEQFKDRRKISTPAVVGAIIDLGHCLNLLDRQFVKVTCDAYDSLVDASRRAKTKLPGNVPLKGKRDLVLRHLDCAVINTVHEQAKHDGLRPYDTVRSAFIEGKPIYPNSTFKDRNHIQICVRTLHCIKGYFHPLDEPSAKHS
jgi:hypothetical protein